jgi:hypothetical protein
MIWREEPDLSPCSCQEKLLGRNRLDISLSSRNAGAPKLRIKTNVTSAVMQAVAKFIDSDLGGIKSTPA